MICTLAKYQETYFKAYEHELYWYTLWYIINNDHDEIKECLKYLEHIIDHMYQVMKILYDLDYY